jgi:hypothetical protein
MTDHFLYKAQLRSFSDVDLAESFASVVTEKIYTADQGDSDYMDDLETVRILLAEEINRRKDDE